MDERKEEVTFHRRFVTRLLRKNGTEAVAVDRSIKRKTAWQSFAQNQFIKCSRRI